MTTTFAILCNPGYFAGDTHGRDKAYLLTSEADGSIIALASAAEAGLICKMMEPSGGVHLDDNQHSLPTYSVVPAPSGAQAKTLGQAMRLLDLHHDFREDGSRIPA
jgi:hypothetical protein